MSEQNSLSPIRTNWRSIAAEGDTVDGRKLTAQDLNDMAETYNPKMYGARINLIHSGEWSGLVAKELYNIELDGGMLGDVMELKVAKNDENILCLYAILAPNQSAVKLSRAGQAVFFSIEKQDDFRGTGKTYLTGLALTDRPASCWTDRTNFNASFNALNQAIVEHKMIITDIYQPITDADETKGQKSEQEKNSAFSWLDKFKTQKTSDLKMNEEQLNATVATAVSQALQEPFSKMVDVMESFANKKGKQEQPSETNDKPETDDKYAALEEKYNQLQGQFDALKTEESPSTTKFNEDFTSSENFKAGKDDNGNSLL